MPESVDSFILVRHAMPVLCPDVPADRWELDEQGRAASRAMADALPPSGYFVASTEPKALQTLQEMAGGRDVVPEPGFREVGQPYQWSDDYHDLVRAYLEGTCHDGWEPHEQVRKRFEDAFQRHAEKAAAAGQTLVVGTHGLSATVWLASRLPLEPDAIAFWSGLGLPDVVHVDLAGKQTRKHRSA